jgi:hypothetical protein
MNVSFQDKQNTDSFIDPKHVQAEWTTAERLPFCLFACGSRSATTATRIYIFVCIPVVVLPQVTIEFARVHGAVMMKQMRRKK